MASPITGSSARSTPGPSSAVLGLVGLVALPVLLLVVATYAIDLRKPSIEELSEHPFVDGPPGASELGRVEQGDPGFFGFLADAAGPRVAVTWASTLTPRELVEYYEALGLRRSSGSDAIATRMSRRGAADGPGVYLHVAIVDDARLLSGVPRDYVPPPGVHGFVRGEIIAG